MLFLTKFSDFLCKNFHAITQFDKNIEVILTKMMYHNFAKLCITGTNPRIPRSDLYSKAITYDERPKKTAFLSGISLHFRPFVVRFGFSCFELLKQLLYRGGLWGPTICTY